MMCESKEKDMNERGLNLELDTEVVQRNERGEQQFRGAPFRGGGPRGTHSDALVLCATLWHGRALEH
jgi:hypothetical protein